LKKMLTKDEAITIRTVDYSETSQVLTLFAKQSGKLTAIAKGSKRPKSPFDGPIDLLAHGKIVFSNSNREKLATLTEFQLLHSFSNIPAHLFTYNCSLFAAELVGLLTDDYDAHPVLFDKFLVFLTSADNAKIKQPATQNILAALIIFQLDLLKEIGLKPVLNACGNCKSPFDSSWPEVYFSPAAAALLCKDCEQNFPDKTKLTKIAAKRLARLGQGASHSAADTPSLPQADPNTLRQIEKVLINYLTYILNRPPKMAKHILSAKTI